MKQPKPKGIFKHINEADVLLKFKAADVDPDTVAHQLSELMENLDLLGPRQRAEMEIAIAEALINAVDYGCLGLKQSEKAPDLDSPSIYHIKRKERLQDPAWAEKEIQIRLSFDPEKITLKIQDPGPGIPETICKPKEILPYGRGIQLMRELVDKLIIRRNPSVLTMIKSRG